MTNDLPFDADELRALFIPLNSWEDKYRALIQSGKRLPSLTPEQRIAAKEINGCENRVWIGVEKRDDGTLHFFGDSEGRIVRGLLAVLLTAIEGMTPEHLTDSDPLALFDELGLSHQLSASRTQGLNAMAAAIKTAVR